MFTQILHDIYNTTKDIRRNYKVAFLILIIEFAINLVRLTWGSNLLVYVVVPFIIRVIVFSNIFRIFFPENQEKDITLKGWFSNLKSYLPSVVVGIVIAGLFMLFFTYVLPDANPENFYSRLLINYILMVGIIVFGYYIMFSLSINLIKGGISSVNLKKTIKLFFASDTFLRVLTQVFILTIIVSIVSYLTTEASWRSVLNEQFREAKSKGILNAGSLVWYTLSSVENIFFSLAKIYIFFFAGLLEEKSIPSGISRLTFKRIIIFILLTSYFLTWLCFGLAYQRIATQSHGKDYIFQEDILLQLRIKEFKKVTGNLSPDEVIRDLIINKEYDKKIFNFITSENKPLLINLDGIGTRWSQYYKTDLIAKGVSGYSIKVGRKYTPFIGEVGGEGGVYPITITLYKPKDDGTSKFQLGGHEITATSRVSSSLDDINFYAVSEDFSQLVAVDEIEIEVMDNNIVKAFTKLNENHGPKIVIKSTLDNLLKYSITYLNSDIYNLQEVVNGDYNYQLADFLYFSAITITTTGYGDILPNSSVVRDLVMIETFLGVILVGAFISSLFMKIE